jgi:hypothetical protein
VCQGDSRAERIALALKYLDDMVPSDWLSGGNTHGAAASSPVPAAANIVASLLAACEQPGAQHALLPADRAARAALLQAVRQARLRPPLTPSPGFSCFP